MTTRTIIPILLSFTLFSCSLATAQQTDQQNRDIICKRCIDSALIEIKKGRLVVCCYSTVWISRQFKEFKTLLHKNGLEWTMMDDDDNIHCYAKTMNQAIEQKFGEGFIDKLLAKADTIMLNNRGNKY